MINIIELAKKCQCNHCTIRKWVKTNTIQTSKVKSSNGKKVASLTDEDASKFIKYWSESTTMPEGMMTIPELSKKAGVDRKTIRLWAERNNVAISAINNSKGPPIQIITLSQANVFIDEYTNSDHIPVSYFLDNYNTDRRTIRRWAKKNNRDFLKVKSSKGGRTNFAISKADSKDLKEHLTDVKSDGFFYMVQPVPELNPNRIKLGFSKVMVNRMRQHRSVCPNARLVKKWRCKKDDEVHLRNMATTDGCTRLYNEADGRRHATEVFDCENFQLILDKLERHFLVKESL